MPKLSSNLVKILVLARGGETDKALHEIVNMVEAGGDEAVQGKIFLQLLRSFGALKDHGSATARSHKATSPNMLVELMEQDGFVRENEVEVMGKLLLVMTRQGGQVFVPFYKPKAETAASEAA